MVSFIGDFHLCAHVHMLPECRYLCRPEEDKFHEAGVAGSFANRAQVTQKSGKHS